MPFRFADAIFWIAVACCSIAQLAIVRSIVKTRAVADAPGPARTRRAAEFLWAILPGLALIVVLVFTWRAMSASRASGRGPTPAGSVSAATFGSRT